jgi:putative salt-induced outer membrane protein YdiY
MALKKIFSELVILIITVMPGIVGADELWLTNGDHLTGKVIVLEAEKLQFQTTYAGKIAISWKEITNLKTEAPISMVLMDGSIAKGTVEAGNDGRVHVKSLSTVAPVTFFLSEVKQINPAPPGPSVKLKGRVNIGVTVTRGNTETDTYYGEGELVARSGKNRFTLGARLNKEEDHGEKTVDNQTGYMKYDHFLTKKLYLQANAAGTKDEFKDLNLRSTFGLGVGYQLLETDKTNLSFEAGGNYVNEDYIVVEDDSFMAGRWAWHFDHFFYRNAFQFFHSLEGLISLEDTNDMTIQSQTGFRFFLFKNFNATTQLNFDWDKSPSPGLKKADRAFLVTLGYQF